MCSKIFTFLACYVRPWLCFAVVLVIALFNAPSPTLSQSPSFAPEINLAKRKRTLTFRFSNSQDGCIFKLFAAGSPDQLATRVKQGDFLFQDKATVGENEFVARRLASIKRARLSAKVFAYFTASIDCPSSSIASTQIRLRLAVSARGGKGSVALWIKDLRHKLGPTALSLSLVDAFPALEFSAPIDIQSPTDNSARLFIVEQGGTIRVLSNTTAGAQNKLFLDLGNKTNASGEQGLLSMAFHPKFANNRRFFVHYSRQSDGATIIAEYKASAQDPNQADLSSERIILTQSQPFSNHNGGQITFGPDGFLYIALGDGGSGGDPQGNGQNRKTLLGKILRINVDSSSDSREYAIPASNPYANNSSGFREEIYAYGLRNPWKISFDSFLGVLYAADVGQGRIEEVDIIESGKNYGWNTMEGDQCYDPPDACDQAGLTLPIASYTHAVGNSITGGYVYRGSAIPSLVGNYVYGDFGSGKIFALEKIGATYQVSNLLSSGLAISTFGVDASGELYVADYSGGKVYRFSTAE